MQYLKNYLNKIISRGNEKLAESISKTAEDIGKDYISTFSFTSHEIGLLFGNSLGVDKGSYPNSKKVVLGLSVTF